MANLSRRPLVIPLTGKLDLYSEERLLEFLEPTLGHPCVVVNFGNVTYIDSTALSVLVRVRKRRAAKGFTPKKFAALHPRLRRVFEISNLDRIWTFYDTVGDALTAFENED